MLLFSELKIVPETPLAASFPVRYAVAALRRDWDAAFVPGKDCPQTTLRLTEDVSLPAEGWRMCEAGGTLRLTATDALGMAYGIYELSRVLLGVLPFWFWNDQKIEKLPCRTVSEGFCRESKPARVRWRGWFINDETLLDHWDINGDTSMPWVMAFEALLRCGGNLVIPGTDKNSKKYRKLASDMGLVITHHHAEPLGAEMFARAYPELEPRFDMHADKFRALWRKAIEAQRGMRVIWNIGFRGQGDRPFWDDDPQYSTPAARGELMSKLILEQYNLVKATEPEALCCTNLYGETMELYRDDFLKLPDDVIKIWADNGYGKMVSRRQGNDNPRVPALPAEGDTDAHGIYYHASFYDLQAASHITMLPNSAEFVHDELRQVLAHGMDDYWLVNCSNIKPHVYMLDYIAKLWRDGDADPAEHRAEYAAAYFGAPNADAVATCLKGYAERAVAYGPHTDDHAGDQFYHHVPRMLISQFMRDRTAPCDDLKWLCDLPTLQEQAAWCRARFSKAHTNYTAYFVRCEAAHAAMDGAARQLFADGILLQAELYRLWSEGAVRVCDALAAGFAGDWKQAFYLAGKAQKLYTKSYSAMRDTEHGKWVGFYANECQTDVEQTAYLCGYLMSFARNMGEGPHFYQWQREFFDSEEDRRIMLLLNTEKHPTDGALWEKMEQKCG